MKIKNKFLLFLFTFLLFFSFLPKIAFAEDSNLSISFQTGFDGKVKMWQSYPVQITVKNEGEKPFKGDLVFRFSSNYETTAGKVVSINVDGGQSKTYEITMPPASDNYYQPNPNTQEITLYKGDWKNGKKVTYKGSKKLNTNIIESQVNFIGILSENPDRFSSFKGSPSTQTQWITLNENNLPEQMQALDSMDIIIVDKFPISSLSDKKIEALLGWVNRGGTLIVGATPNANQTYGKLADELPMKNETEAHLNNVVISMNPSSKFTFKELQVFTGEVDEKYVQYRTETSPLILQKDFGTGRIIQTAFSIGDEPNTSTEGYSEWFVNYALSKKNYDIHTDDYYHSLYWDFGEINEYFEGTNISPTVLVVILLFYIIILVPVLYFILKKRDKREHSWWLIPTISIVTSLIIFGFGAKNRIAHPLKNEMGIFMANNNQLNGYYSVAIQSNTSGNYQLKMKQNEYAAVPISGYYGGSNDSETAFLMDKRNDVEVVFPNIEYWSIRSLIGEAHQNVEGMFNLQLSVEDKTLNGTITNEYPYDFEEVFLWSGTNQYKIGSLKKGETKQVAIELKNTWLSSPLSSGYGYSISNDLDLSIKEALKNGVYHTAVKNTAQPVIAGFTKDPVVNIAMEGKNAKTKRTVLLLQPFKANIDYEGDFTLNSNQFQFELIPIKGNQFSGGYYDPMMGMERELYLDRGTYDFIYTIPEALQLKEKSIEEITVRLRDVRDQFSILNQKTGEYLSINDFGSYAKLTENANDYLTNEGQLIIRVEKTSDEDPLVYIPDLSMKGSVKK